MNKKAGLGYRAPFKDSLMMGHSDIGWLEVITENYLWDKGRRRHDLEKLREHYDLAFHGVSLSIAAPDEHDEKYLQELKVFCDDFSPVRVSDHLCWSSLGGHHWHDLLPFPYTEDNLEKIAKKIHLWQDILKRPLILENLSAYIQTKESTMSEFDFLGELCRKTSCKLLLDLNNMIVNSRNFKIDPLIELKKINLKDVAQVHLAGFVEGEDFVIDTHSTPPVEETWSLWKNVSSIKNDIPFMIEWDSDIPAFSSVLEELKKGSHIQKSFL